MIKITLSSLQDLQNRLHETSLTVLLGLQIAVLFVIVPLVGSYGVQYSWIIDVFLMITALLSIFAVKKSLGRYRTFFSFALCIAGLVYSRFIADYKTSAIVLAVSGVTFYGIVNWAIGKKLFAEGSVTMHRIRGAIVIYLNIALIFALLDNLLVYLLPNAYSNISSTVKSNIGTMVYFSFTTLTTTGYGDIVPVHPFARSLANLESVVGQFYLATLIAILVGLHVSQRQKKDHNIK